MSEIDKVKERIGYLKFWLGIQVAAAIADISWIVDAIGDISISDNQSPHIHKIYIVHHISSVYHSEYFGDASKYQQKN